MSDQEESVQARYAVDEAMALVGRLVAEIPDHVKVLPGFGDEQMDTWNVPVPEDVRLLLRRMSGLELTNDGYPWYFGPISSIDVTTDNWRFGRAGTFWVLRATGAGDTVYVDVDPTTGRWGPVFLVGEELNVTLVAPSLAWYVAQTAHQFFVALERASDEETPPEDLELVLEEFVEDAFGETLPSYGEGIPNAGFGRLTPQSAVSQRQAADPILAGVAAAVPDDTLIADLEGAGYLTGIAFSAAFTGPGLPFFERSHGGRFVYAFERGN